MAKHRAPRYVRTKEILAGVPVVAGATFIGLGVLSSPAQAHVPGPTAAVDAPTRASVEQYMVKPGDTLAEIAAAHGRPWRELYQRNAGIVGGNPNVLLPGQVLAIFGAAPAAQAHLPASTPAAGSATANARITNSAGPVRPQTQAAADAVIRNVAGAAGLTIGGTRASAADPGGHPSGLALDYMVLSNTALGDAIAQYHIANWDRLGVDYIIWQQRMLSSPTGTWKPMADRGSTTANHMDHPHVNYRAG